MTSRLLLSYAERRGGRSAVEEILRRCGLEGTEAHLRDENAWFGHATKLRMFETAVEVLDDPLATRRMGESALELGVAEGLKSALRALGTPSLVYRNVVKANAKFNAMHRMELHEMGRGRARMSFVDISGAGFHPLDCQYNLGLLSCVPAMFGQPPAHVAHEDCACEGAEACTYDVTWRPYVPAARFALACGAVGAVAATLPLLAAPSLEPFGLAVAAGCAAASGWRAIGASRRRNQALERDLGEQQEVNERLVASMQHLAGELRLEDLLDKITHNARAAVGGSQFALFVVEEDALRCQSSSDLSEETVRAIEAWLAEHPLDRVEQVEVHEVCMCVAPLSYGGRSLGALVATAPSMDAFLPRDLDLLASYATQAAIALANARLFEAQERLAARDPLTGLLNRRELEAANAREVARSQRHGRDFALVLFDLDGFKEINDLSGHAAGDDILRAVGSALAGSCRPSDLAFRVGGDEFALLLPETHDRAGAIAAAERADDAMAAVDGRVGVSYGVAGWPLDGADLDALLLSADRRLYAMKSARLSASARKEGMDSRRATSAHRERLAVASRLSTRLADLSTSEAIAGAAAEEVRRAFGHVGVQLLRLGSDERLRTVPGERIVEGICTGVARCDEPALLPDSAASATDGTACSELAVPVRVAGRVWGVLSMTSTGEHSLGHDDLLMADTAAAQVGSALALAELRDRYEDTLASTIAVLSDALEAKDAYTAAHARDVAELTKEVGARLGLSEPDLRALGYAALLHDIGKIGVPSEILNKPGPLTDAEFEEVKQHTVIGARMLERVPGLEPVLPLIRSAHERWDGAGYPDRLAGEDIPLAARVICACDAFHAMVSDRPYRPAMPEEDAVAEMRRCAGSHFDSRVVEALLEEIAV